MKDKGEVMRLRSVNPYGRFLLILWLAGHAVVYGQVKSRIAGRITDAQTGEALPGANVMIEGLSIGTASNNQGQYVIVNVPVGNWRVRATMMGYESRIMSDVVVSADRVSKADFSLSPTVIEGAVVEVTAQKDELHKEVSNTQLVVSDVQLQEAAGIREINSFLTKLPGVSEDNGYLSIRGGSADQTGIMINGFSYGNAAVGNAETSIPLSAIEQVSLMSGGYNAEYGNFRSGLINVTTKSGSRKGYNGTFSFSRDNAHIRRFGESFYSTKCQSLKPFLDPSVAFIGTEAAWGDDEYTKGQYESFQGWNKAADDYNRIYWEEGEIQASPLDYYLLACWMHMAIPDYDGLAEQGYTVPEEQKKLFEEHHMKDDEADWNFDGGFGGPIPLVGEALGDATFYISHNAKERHYIMPVTRSSEEMYTTLLTMKSQPTNSLTVTVNALHKRQIGVSPIRPPWGDFPDASREGGFMPIDNIKYFEKIPEYWYDQPLYPILKQNTWMGGITLNHVLSNSTFWELSLSALQIRDSSPTGDTRDSTVITRFGPFPVTEMPYGKLLYGVNEVDGYEYPSYDALPGVSRRFRRKEGDLYTNVKVTQYRAKFDLASQVNVNHYLKGGIEYNYIDLNHKLWEQWNENYYNVYEFNYRRKPSQTGVYIQDQISLESIVANLGVRFDYYYGGGGKWPSGDPFAEEAFRPQEIPSDSILFQYLQAGKSYIWDTWEQYDKEHPGFLQPIKNHFTISPRIGVSFPVTEQSKFYFNYGHFRSNPPYYSMYLYRYRYDKNGLYDMSNPNLVPPRTISYELGLAANVFKSYVLKISGYTKDVTGQHGEVNYISDVKQLNYDFLANNEYEDIQGLEINLSKNDAAWLTGWINFNYMIKKEGNTGREEITEIDLSDNQAGLYAGQETRSLPTPKLNANITFSSPAKWGPRVMGMYPFETVITTIFAEWEAGDYFTWNPLDKLHVSNNLQWPSYKMIDLKVSKKFKLAGLGAMFYVDIKNVFNIKVNMMSKKYPFKRAPEGETDLDDRQDFKTYMMSLRLPMYDSPEYDALREGNPGSYLPGDDKVGDLRSGDQPYINDPNWDFWLFGEPRDIWVGLNISF